MTLFICQSVISSIICLIACITDSTKKKIPNVLTFSGIIAGLILNVILAPKQLLITIPILIGLFLFGITGIIGLGDLKLYMALTAIGGWCEFVVVFAASMIIALLYGIIRHPIETSFYLQKFFAIFAKQKYVSNKKTSSKLIFAWFILCGVAVYILFFNKCSPFYYLIYPYLLH